MKVWKVWKVSLVLEKASDRGAYPWWGPRLARFCEQEWQGKRKFTPRAGGTEDKGQKKQGSLTSSRPLLEQSRFGSHSTGPFDIISLLIQIRTLWTGDFKLHFSDEKTKVREINLGCLMNSWPPPAVPDRTKEKELLLGHRLTTPPQPGAGDSAAGLPSCSALSAHSSPPLSQTEFTGLWLHPWRVPIGLWLPVYRGIRPCSG